MRKIYSLALMAVMLLVSANGWATDVAQIGDQGYTSLKAAFEAVPEATHTEIKLLRDANESEKISIVNKDITLDLNGCTIFFPNGWNKSGFSFNGGIFTIKGKGEIKNTPSEDSYAICVFGSTEPTANKYSVLNVGPDVTFNGNDGSDLNGEGDGTYTIWIMYKQIEGTGPGHAYGVEINMEGKILTSEQPFYVQGMIKDKTGNIPVINIKKGAQLIANGYNNPKKLIDGNSNYPNRHSKESEYNVADNTGVHNDTIEGSCAIYAAGYAKWIIGEAYIEGPNGIYLKSGELSLSGTEIHAKGNFAAPVYYGNGFCGNGVGLIYDSNKGYGEIGPLTIESNTSIKSENAYAILETITSGPGSKTNGFVIKGGSFIGGGDYPALKTTTDLQQKLQDAVGNDGITGGLFYNQDDLNDYVNKNGGGTVTPIKDEEGNTVYVVTQQEGETKNFAEASATDNANLDANATIKNGEVKEVKNLYVKGTSVLTIEKGGKLIVNGTLTIEANANVTVEAGGVIVIKGGVNSVNTKNFVLKATANDQAILLYSPEITGWSNPKGIVELYTNVGKNAQGERLWQRFGLGLKTLSSASRTPAVAPTIVEWNYTNDSWMTVADVKTMKPFVGYAVSHNEEQKEVIFSFNGSLYGHESENFTLVTNGWNYFANSYMGKASASALLSDILGVNGVEATIQIWDPTQQNFVAVPANSLADGKENAGREIYPLQTMVLRSTGATTAPVVKFDYANAIWNPAMGIKSAAPRRVIQTTDDTYARITIMAADGQVDRVSLCEDAQFSEEFDNGADATKLMSPNHINLYATIGENNYAAVATDDIEGTMLSMETMTGIDYTMSFDYVSGDALGVKDMRTGVVTAIKEGNTYTFVANENSIDANRFQIVRMPKVVTSVENAEDAAAPKGVYTIMGQYLGDTTMWESLPSGVYVVDGVKMVK